MSLRIYGNRQLKTVPGQATRPTTGRVREALFNIWQGSIQGCIWLDLCAGNGVMGAEALCRGAVSVIGIEKAGLACRTIQQNWQRIASADQTYQVIRGDVLVGLSKLAGQQFHHIYFDPPYHSDLYQPVLRAIARHQLLTPDGELAVEHEETAWEAIAIAGLMLRTQKRYGRTTLSFYRSAVDADVVSNPLDY
ncbi:16S rRNA (guanine(966)-N(2))-methyltransferase RsmD [Oscillatoria sp. CS-180]|uniref:16S rRNA (guanine(966)-N(2))-methyltransferase RsmD n=1 Tax=Oscillatoria sp. CS-180 TaxID=3021720 RepID=UPI00232D134C|nr:16S rRNA (guanine(966)-N(2))-methyltransferase RsmD [Oscillatoria sp. CS-180]MDB9527233.1 16S rRNA (guanine(966)-N(2))-methyltransferase RsmD [Oscillatoria sp. CS-180]